MFAASPLPGVGTTMIGILISSSKCFNSKGNYRTNSLGH